VVYTAVQKILIDPMPYKKSADLYYVCRDYGSITDVKRGTLAELIFWSCRRLIQ
jgi:hypothetical protein